VDGEHYDEHTKTAPVVNEATIQIIFILMIMALWYSELIDFCSIAFLHGQFSKEGNSIWRCHKDSRSIFHGMWCFYC